MALKMELHLDKLSSAKRIALGEILGTIPSDAYFGLKKDGLFNYILASKDKEFTQLIAKAFSNFGINVKIHRRPTGLWYIEVTRRCFDEFTKFLMEKEKVWIFVPLVVSSNYKDFKAAILRSFADADGTCTAKFTKTNYFSRRIAFYNKSRHLLFQLQEMLKSFGINSYLRMDRVARIAKIKSKEVSFPTVYSLRITNYRNLDLFANLVNFGIPRKKRKLTAMLESYRQVGKEHSVEDYQKVLTLYPEVKNYMEVSRRLLIPRQTIRNWVLLGIKPRKLLIQERKML